MYPHFETWETGRAGEGHEGLESAECWSVVVVSALALLNVGPGCIRNSPSPVGEDSSEELNSVYVL